MKKVILYISLFFIALNLSSQTRLIDAKIKPLNRGYLFFNDLPAYTSSLNQEKNKITIRINKTGVLDSAKEVIGTGIISEIFSVEKADSLIVSLLITDPRGYTAIALPYSKAILVETFRWDNIASDEDLYREALLNMESGFFDKTKEMLSNSKLSDHPNANAILGVIYLMEDNAQMVFDNIRKSIKLNTNIPDAFVVYGQFFEYFDMQDSAKIYYRKFEDITGRKDFPKFTLSLDSSYKDRLLGIKSTSDTNAISDVMAESLKKPIKFQDTTALDESLSITDSYWFYILVVVVILFIFIVFTYYKWRQSQLSRYTEKKEISKTRFEEEVKMAKDRSAREILAKQQRRDDQKDSQNKSQNKNKSKQKSKQSKAGASKAGASLLNKTYGDDNKSAQKKENPLPDNFKQKRVIPKSNVQEIAQTNKLEEFLETFIPLKQAEERQIEKASQELIEDDFEESVESSRSNRPNIELAIHLAEEKQKLKKQQIKKLSNQELDMSQSTDELSKKLGVEKSTIETKSNLDKYSKDKSSLEKLNKKFNKNK